MLVLVAIIGAAVYFFAFSGSAAAGPDALKGKRPVALEDILGGRFHVWNNNATWISNSELLFRDETVSSPRNQPNSFVRSTEFSSPCFH